MKLLIQLGLVLGLTAPLSAQLAVDPLVVQPGQLNAGIMTGFWNLPLNSSLGVAGGTLSLGVPQFQMLADLPAEPLEILPNGLIVGSFQGGLQAFPLSPNGSLIYNVSGTWIWNPETGKGHYNGYISTLSLPNPGGLPIYLIGIMRGRFEDQPPVTPLAPDPLGSFTGLWTFNFLSAPAPVPVGQPYPGPGQDTE